MSIEIRALGNADRRRVAEALRERWGSDVVVAHGDLYRAAELEGFLAEDDDRLLGVLTFVREGEAVEIVTLDAFERRRGVGTMLVDAARGLGASRLWLITTNDNESAQRFYEAVGFRLVAVHQGAVERSRALKPEIPLTGEGGRPMTDELEYELVP